MGARRWPIRRAAPILALALLSAACTTPEDHLMAADRAVAEDRPRAALRAYRRAAQEPRVAPVAYHRAARVAMDLAWSDPQRLTEALALMEDALRANRERAEVAQPLLHRWADVLARHRDPEAAHAALRRAEAAAPLSPLGRKARARRVRGLLEAQPCAAGLAAWPEVMPDDPARAQLEALVGECLQREGRGSRATKVFERVLKAGGDAHAVRIAGLALSRLYADRGELEAALLVLLDARATVADAPDLSAEIEALKARIARRDAIDDWGMLR